MAGNDELIYRIKFEADEESKQNVEQSLKEWQEQLDDTAVKDAVGMTVELKTSMEELNESQLQGIDRLIELRSAIDEYRTSLKTLRDAKKAGIQLTEEEKASEVEIRAALKNTSQEYRNAEKELIANTLAADGAAQSYNQLREENKQLETIMRNIPLDDSSGKLKMLQERVAENKQTMKDFNAEIGDHSMNVGNYGEAMSTAASAVAAFQGPLGPIAGRISAINTTLSRAIPLIKAKAAAWGVLRLAMLSTGIGAIVVALGTMVAALSTMQPVMDSVTKRWSQLAAIWGSARDTIGSWFGMNEKSNNSMRDSIRIAGELADAQVLLEEQRIREIEQRARLDTQISQLRRDAEDEENSARERISFMDEALQKTQELFDMRVAEQKEAVRIAQAKADMARNEREDDEALAEAKAELIRLEGQQAMSERQLIRRKQSIINELRVEEERRQKNIDSIREEAQAYRDNAEERANALLNDANQSLMEKRQQRRIDFLKSTEQERLAVTEQAEFERQKVISQSNEAIKEAEKQELEAREAIYKELMIDGQLSEEEARKQALIQSNRLLNEEIADIERASSIEITNINEDEQDKLTAIEREGHQARQNIRQQVGQLRAEQAMSQHALEIALRKGVHQELALLEIEQGKRRQELLVENLKTGMVFEEALRHAHAQSVLEFEKKFQDTFTAIEQHQLQDRLQMQQAYADLAFGVMNAAFGDTKAVRIAQAIIDTYAGATSALADPGGRLGLVQAAATVAIGLANVRKIMETDVGDKPSGGGGGGASAAAMSSPMGFETIGQDESAVAKQVAEQSFMDNNEPETNIYLEGDLNSELLSIKARQGNRMINTKTLTTKSRGT